MHLLLLDGPASQLPGFNPSYRGTHRAVPSHCDDMPDDEEINELFFWYLEEGGEEGVVRNRAKALRFAELWNRRLPRDRQFEVVEVIGDSVAPSGGGRVLGFDISSGLAGYSLLVGGLAEIPKTKPVPDAIRKLANLLARFYRPKLNEHDDRIHGKMREVRQLR